MTRIYISTAKTVQKNLNLMVSGFLGTAFRLSLLLVARVGMMYSVMVGMG
jgi:hypothetical protein